MRNGAKVLGNYGQHNHEKCCIYKTTAYVPKKMTITATTTSTDFRSTPNLQIHKQCKPDRAYISRYQVKKNNNTLFQNKTRISKTNEIVVKLVVQYNRVMGPGGALQKLSTGHQKFALTIISGGCFCNNKQD